jgi:hypothetical protein
MPTIDFASPPIVVSHVTPIDKRAISHVTPIDKRAISQVALKKFKKCDILSVDIYFCYRLNFREITPKILGSPQKL